MSHVEAGDITLCLQPEDPAHLNLWPTEADAKEGAPEHHLTSEVRWELEQEDANFFGLPARVSRRGYLGDISEGADLKPSM